MRDESRDDISHWELATILKFSALISSCLNIEVVLSEVNKGTTVNIRLPITELSQLEEQ